MEKRFLVKRLSKPEWLDGFDGQDFEFTNDKKKAWRVSEKQATTYKVKLNSLGFFVEILES